MKWALTIASFFFVTLGLSQVDSTTRSFKDYVRLKGYVKNMQTLTMADLNYVSHQNLIHNRLNFRIYPSKSLTVGLEIRNRIFTGDMVNFNPFFTESVDFDHGLVDLSFAWIDQQGIVALTQIDRGWLRWSNDRWDVTIGRQRINWGVNMFWNSNDLFNTFNLVDFDYEERPGTDAIRVQHYFKDYSTLEIAIAPSEFDSTWVGAGMYKFNKWNYDFQVIGGWWNEDIAIGTGWAGNLKNAGWKGEVTYFHPQKNAEDTNGSISASISFDNMFTGNLYVMAGVLFNSQGIDSTFNLANAQSAAFTSTAPPSAKSLMPTKYSAILSFSRPITPLVNASLVGLYSPGANLMFVMPSLSFGIASNWEFSIFAQTTLLDNGRVFRNYGTSTFGRLKWGF